MVRIRNEVGVEIVFFDEFVYVYVGEDLVGCRFKVI